MLLSICFAFGLMPSDAEIFRAHAVESRAMAARASTQEIKAGFEEIAKQWELMAEAAEAQKNR